MTTQADWDAKFEEIVVAIGRKLFGDEPLKPAQELEARVDAESAIAEWEMADSWKPQGEKTRTLLQILLVEQHEIAERIKDARDTDQSRERRHP